MSKLLWPLLVVNLRITGLIWRGKASFVQNNTTSRQHNRLSVCGGERKESEAYLTTLDELRARCHAERRRSSFGAKLTAWRHKIFHIFHFLQSDMVFENASPFLCIFNAISSEKRGLISVPFLTC